MKILATIAVVLVLLQPAVAIPQAQEGKVTIEGIVTRVDNGRPIAGAQLMISRLATNAQGTLTRVEVAPRPAGTAPLTRGAASVRTNVLTDAEGKFQFTDLDPGLYRIIATAEGYIRQEYGQRSVAAGVGTGTLIDLTSGQNFKNATMQLTPTATVRGRLLDEAGQPAVGVPVRLTHYPFDASGNRILRQVGTASSNDRGEYRLFGLPPGRYYVEAGSGAGPLPSGRGAPSILYASRYFPGVADLRQASTIEVKTGGDVVADMTLSRLQPRKVRGRVVDLTGTANPASAATPGFSLSYAWDSTNTIDGCGCFTPVRSYDPNTGNFELQNIAPGSYKLTASKPDPGRVMPAPGDFLDLFTSMLTSSESSITIGNSDIENVVVTFEPRQSLPVKVAFEGQALPEASLQRLRVQYRRSTNGVVYSIGATRQASVAADGSFRIDAIHPGEYLVSIVGVPVTHYIKSLESNGQNLLNGPMRVSGSAGSGIAVVLSSDPGQVNGVVTDATTRPVAGVPVVLVPQGRQPSLYRNVVTDRAGQFTMSGIAPGEYKVFAWDGMEPFRYFDPDFMKLYEARGKSIRVTAATAATADVQVIPVE